MENQEEVLDAVKIFAAQAHGDQMRKFVQEKYIEHPIRVMEHVRKYGASLPMLSAALLHDVLEDTDVTEHELQQFLEAIVERSIAEATLHLVIELTDVYTKANYPALNRRIRKTKEAQRLAQVSPEAQTIKCADIFDNLKDVVNDDSDFALVYIRESKVLLQQMKHGDPTLRPLVIQMADEALQEFYQKSNIRSL